MRTLALLIGLLCALPPAATAKDDGAGEQKIMRPHPVTIERVGDGPIIHAELDPSLGSNIQGPSLIRVPEWVDDPLGRYYLYFADHKGRFIRLAYADALTGPWQIHAPGSLTLAESGFPTEPPEVSEAQRQEIEARIAESGIRFEHDVLSEITTPHIASPDVHVDDERRRILMYFHGLEDVAHQVTRVATSSDGIHFEAQQRPLGRTYLRVFRWDGDWYGLAMPGQLYRSQEPLGDFETGPRLFDTDMRHNAVLVRGHTLHVFWTRVGDAPEHIKHSTIDLRPDWSAWQVRGTREVLRPELVWEGADAPVEPSLRSTAYGLVNQLRDPAIFVEPEGEGEGEEEAVYLLYAFGGESGIALARVRFEQAP